MSAASTSSLATWCKVQQMGHRTLYGWVTVDTSLGVPMLRVDYPAVDGDEAREPIEASWELIAAGSLFAVSPCTEAEALAWRAQRRPNIDRLLLTASDPDPELGDEDLADDEDTPF